MNTKESSIKIADSMYEQGTFKTDILSYIQTRVPIFAIDTLEEERFLKYMSHFTRIKNMRFYIWDIIEGLKDGGRGDKIDLKDPPTILATSQEEVILAYISSKYKNIKKTQINEDRDKGIMADVYILLDFCHMLKDPRIIRRLKEIYSIPSTASVILVGSDLEDIFNGEMRTLIPTLLPTIPGDKELKMIIDDIVGSVSKILPNIIKEAEDKEKDILKLVSGKTVAEAQFILSKNISTYRSFLGKNK